MSYFLLDVSLCNSFNTKLTFNNYYMIIIFNEHYKNYISNIIYHKMYVQSFNYIHLYEI